MQSKYPPRGTLFGEKSGWLVGIQWTGPQELGDAVTWATLNGIKPGMHSLQNLLSDQKITLLTGSGVVNQDQAEDTDEKLCPDHKSPMKQSAYKPGLYYCDVGNQNWKCDQRWNEQGYFRAKSKGGKR